MSVVVPVYKVEKYLPETIESIISQDFDDFEAIFIDDASPDSCPAILDSAQEKFPSKIRVIHLKENGGLCFARKVGVLAAKGKYLVFLDGDDVFLPDALSAMVMEIEKTNADIVLFSYRAFSNDPAFAQQVIESNAHATAISRAFAENPPCLNSDEILERTFFNPKTVYSIWTQIFKNEIIQQAYQNIDAFNITMSEDVFANIIIRHFAQHLAFSGRPVVNYRVGSGISYWEEAGFKKIQYSLIAAKNIHNSLARFIQNHKVSPQFLKVAAWLPRYVLEVRCRAVVNLWEETLDSVFADDLQNPIYLFGTKLLHPTSRAEKIGNLVLFPFRKLRELVLKIEKNPIGKVLLKPARFLWHIFITKIHGKH